MDRVGANRSLGACEQTFHLIQPAGQGRRQKKKTRKKKTSVIEDYQRDGRAQIVSIFILLAFFIRIQYCRCCVLSKKLIGEETNWRRFVKNARPRDGIRERRHTA